MALCCLVCWGFGGWVFRCVNLCCLIGGVDVFCLLISGRCVVLMFGCVIVNCKVCV